MVIKTKQFGKKEAAHLGGPSRKDFRVAQPVHPKQPDSRPKRSDLVVCVSSEEAVDVIDLGAPRVVRHSAPVLPPPRRIRQYTPNPRLYPGPAAAKPKRRPQRSEGKAQRQRVFRRPVPNARLYRPAPRRVPPPPTPVRGWPPPPHPAPTLETASRAALRLAAEQCSRQSAAPAHPAARASAAQPAPPSRRLVVTLPGGGGGGGGGMDARHSTSPDDCSDADAPHAPSEFLAEFLSAIMRRQYAEALKYCRLILQYEPHNATARGFYPLLRHKVQALNRNEVAEGSSSSDSSAYSPAQQSPHARSLSNARSLSHSHSHSRSHSRSHSSSRARGSKSSVSAMSALEGTGSEGGATGAGGAGAGGGGWARSGSSGSVASQSSLELDSSEPSASGSGSPAPAPAPARADANGNPPATRATPDDLKNDNDVSHLKTESSASLRRLRAQFACSIK